MRKFLNELKRRHVPKAALSYIVVAWVFLQAGAIIFPLLEIPSSVLRGCFLLLLVGFPFWIAFAYIFDFTSEGIKRTEDLPEVSPVHTATSRRQNRLIIGGLSLAVVLLVADRVFSFTRMGTDNDLVSTIAVLPFSNLSPDADNEYFASGVHSDVMDKLASLGAFRIICRTSVKKYKDYEGDLKVVGERLGADYIMEGSVRRADDQVRISAQLIEAKTNQVIWSDTYDRKLENIFELQSDIAREIAGKLQASISTEEGRQLDRAPTVVMAAYDSFLKARSIYNESWVPYDRLMQVIGHLETALEADPKFSEGWALMAEAQSNRYYSVAQFDDREEEMATAKKEALNALEMLGKLDPESQDYHQAAAVYALDVEGDRIACLRSLDKALAIRPDDPAVLFLQGYLYSFMGEMEKGVASFEKSYELDPENGRIVYFLTVGYEVTHQYAKMVPFLERLLELEPERTDYAVQAKYYEFLSDGSLAAYRAYEEAVRTVKKTAKCDQRSIQDNEMVVAMFNEDLESYTAAWEGKWDAHHRNHGNWSCPMILNEEANHARLLLEHGSNVELAHNILEEIRHSERRPINENSLCIFNTAVYEPKLDLMEGDTAAALREFDEVVLDVLQNENFPRGAVERTVLLQTADAVAPERAYTIYRQVIAAPVSMVSMETVCANPWVYPNLIRDPKFQQEVREDGRFVEFLDHYGFLKAAT